VETEKAPSSTADAFQHEPRLNAWARSIRPGITALAREALAQHVRHCRLVAPMDGVQDRSGLAAASDVIT
jgi:hypothetical protein